MRSLGVAAALGIDPSRLLRADRVEAPILAEAVRYAHEYTEKRDEQLALRIVNTYAEAQKRGQRRGGR